MDQVIERILQVIEEHREEIIAFGRDIYNHAELGYKEARTSAAFVEKMKALGLPLRTDLAITGAKANLNEERAGNVSLALMGELDALRIPAQAHANPETGAAHCCGHHAQMAGLVGAAIALADEQVARALDGQVIFFAVPAEEYGEVEFKKQLMQQGRITYGGGKCELIHIGAFDDVDLAVAHHLGNKPGVLLGSGSGNGFVSKVITVQGRAAHAAGAPDKGVNALSAASLGLQALGLNRETFRDEDCVRVHPILTRGGDLVNVVPETAVVETLVRGRTLAAIEDAEKKTDRSFRAGALALGGERVRKADLSRHNGGSTDVGDVQHLMPVYTFNTGGVSGDLHTSAFDIVDEENAYLDAARGFAIHAYELLKNGAALAKAEKAAYQPRFADKAEYSAYLERFRSVHTEPLEE